jgi:hypothetical protein
MCVVFFYLAVFANFVAIYHVMRCGSLQGEAEGAAFRGRAVSLLGVNACMSLSCPALLRSLAIRSNQSEIVFVLKATISSKSSFHL